MVGRRCARPPSPARREVFSPTALPQSWVQGLARARRFRQGARAYRPAARREAAVLRCAALLKASRRAEPAHDAPTAPENYPAWARSTQAAPDRRRVCPPEQDECSLRYARGRRREAEAGDSRPARSDDPQPDSRERARQRQDPDRIRQPRLPMENGGRARLWGPAASGPERPPRARENVEAPRPASVQPASRARYADPPCVQWPASRCRTGPG